MNVWHDVSLGFDTEKNTLNCIIEIPAGSKVKYEIDKESGLLMVDRILSSSVHYPCNYGLFPQTYCDDKDPLDVLVLGQYPIAPLSLMKVRPVGVLKMMDGGEGDDKVIAVHVDDPHFRHMTKLSEVCPHLLKEIQQFFESYKALENKKVEITGLGDEKEAIQVVKDSITLYKNNF